MKKTILSLLFAGVSMYANAIDMTLPGAGNVRYGVEAGLNESKTRMDDYEFLAGFNFGAKAEYSLSDNLFVDGQFNFARKGGVAVSETNIPLIGKKRIEKDFKLSYLQLSIGAGYRFAVTNTFGIAPHVGFFGAYGIASELEDSNDEPFADLDFKKGDFGFDLGLNFDLGKNFQLSAGVDLGLVQIRDDDKLYGNTVTDYSDMKTISWYQRFTYFF